jgi:hypothetical protein
MVLGLLAPATVLGACASGGHPLRTFPDRPVAWLEHDDTDVPRAPRERHLENQDWGLLLRDSLTRESIRALSFEAPRPAEDVNAADEVPCSTWFCPRNHFHPMTPAEIAAGPGWSAPPRLPLTITAGKERGVSSGFQVIDAVGRKYLIKLDPPQRPHMATGAEVVANRLLHAAGYHVPGAYPLELDAGELRISPDAEIELSGVADRPFTRKQLDVLLAGAARTGGGRLSAVAVPWLPGRVLGAFDFLGRRSDDPNDRIDHQNRRSLRASHVVLGWLNVEDAGVRNTLDSYVEEQGRRFVRHYLFDFGTGLGSATLSTKSVAQGREHMLAWSRLLAATFSLGLYQRSWQRDVAMWRRAGGGPAELGWFYPAESWEPPEFRTGRKNPAHLRMTSKDAYWGAKVVTSFTDAQIHAAVAEAGYSDAAAARLEQVLRARRDRIGERYLLAYAAVESPQVSADGASLCFEDLALGRGYLRPDIVSYRVELGDGGAGGDGGGASPRVYQRYSVVPASARTCVPLAAAAAERFPYLVVKVETRIGERASRPTSVHLRWRPAQRQFAVVGIDRPE